MVQLRSLRLKELRKMKGRDQMLITDSVEILEFLKIKIN